jgi:hypothetical protein
MPAGTARAAGAAGQRGPVGGWVTALRQGFAAPGEWVAALWEWVAALWEWLSAPGQWVAALWEWLSAPGQWVAALWEWLSAPGQWVAAPGQRITLPRERVAAARQRVRGGGSGSSRVTRQSRRYLFAIPLRRLTAPRQRFPALRQRFSALRQRLRGLAWVSHAAVSYSGFIRHDPRSQMFGSGAGCTSCRISPVRASVDHRDFL